MRWSPILMCGWPGLSQLWLRGHWASLLVSIGFALVLNLALVSTFLWPGSLGETFPLVAWPVIVLVWAASAALAAKSVSSEMAVGRQTRQNQGEMPDTLFIRAQHEYLKGHWEQTETILRQRLQSEPRDLECRLLLATMLRHARRLAEARVELDWFGKFDEAVRWQFEIGRERQLIELIEATGDMTDGQPVVASSEQAA